MGVWGWLAMCDFEKDDKRVKIGRRRKGGRKRRKERGRVQARPSIVKEGREGGREGGREEGGGGSEGKEGENNCTCLH